MYDPIEIPAPVLDAAKKSPTFAALLEEWDLPGRDFGPGNTKSLTPRAAIALVKKLFPHLPPLRPCSPRAFGTPFYDLTEGWALEVYLPFKGPPRASIRLWVPRPGGDNPRPGTYVANGMVYACPPAGGV
jgi:hypothetical protein